MDLHPNILNLVETLVQKFYIYHEPIFKLYTFIRITTCKVFKFIGKLLKKLLNLIETYLQIC